MAIIESIVDGLCQCVPSNVAEGDTLVGFYYVDSSAPDTDPSTDNGLYVLSATPYGIVVQHKDYVWETDPTSVNFRIAVANDASTPSGPEDRYTCTSLSNRPDVFQGLPLDLIRVRLRDAAGAAIANDELPTAIDLEDWSSTRYIDVWGYQAEWQIRAEIVSMSNVATSVRDGPRPAALQLIYPNPFNARVAVEFALEASSDAVLQVYDVSGRLVSTLANIANADGNHVYRAAWNGRDARGIAVSSGVYFCVLRTGQHTETRRMVLIR